jgi:hypothetical protein
LGWWSGDGVKIQEIVWHAAVPPASRRGDLGVIEVTRGLATFKESITLLKTEGLRRRSSLSPILTFSG